MAQVTRSAVVAAPAADVWALIGGFQALPDWHPAVEGSAKEQASDGAEMRRLSLAGGGEILEKSLGSDGMSYGYEILESPLPVANYKAILTAAETGGKTMITWCSTFDATADGAEGAIAGVYEAGLGALTERFGS